MLFFNALGGHFRGDNIFILKLQSSCANADTLVEFVRLLSKVLEPLAQRRRVVLAAQMGGDHTSQSRPVESREDACRVGVLEVTVVAGDAPLERRWIRAARQQRGIVGADKQDGHHPERRALLQDRLCLSRF